MLVAAAVLFYVSYWLISRFEAKRWTDFLAKRARRGLELGGQGTLALTAFLAVYREGAETSLLYQALLGSEGRTRAGLLGLAAGVASAWSLLAVIAAVVKATSVRLPMQLFFKLSGLFLFVLAIVFAGNGVFELQNAGILVTTNLAWMGRGLPWAGLFPNLQVLSVQGLLLFGAIPAWLVVPRSALGCGAGNVRRASNSPPSAAESLAGVRRVAALDRSDRGRRDPRERGRLPGAEPELERTRRAARRRCRAGAFRELSRRKPSTAGRLPRIPDR